MTDDKSSVSRASRMRRALVARFTPATFTLIDDSGRHAGHAGANPEGESHFSLRMVSSAFAGLSRVARQRLVHDALQEEFATGLHALALDLKTPEEAG